MRLTVPPRDEALRWLAEQGIANPAVVLAQAGGAPFAAIRVADPALQAERAVWLAALAAPRRLLPSLLAARIDQAPRDQRKDRLADVLDWLVDWSADLARVAAGGPAMRNPEQTAAFDTLAPKVARVGLSRYHRSLLRRRAVAAHPLVPRLVAAATLVEYRALFD
jgi:DNA polymerase-3 subunit delta'